MKRIYITIIKYAIELIIVAFGVFLGFYITDLNLQHNLNEDKAKAINVIQEELVQNQTLLEEKIKYHQKIQSELNKFTDSIDMNLLQSSWYEVQMNNSANIKGWKGFRYARLENTAFESAKISGTIKEFDINLLQNLSSVYNYQSRYLDFGELILARAMDLNSSSNLIDFIATVEIMTNDLLYMEMDLNEKINSTINVLDSVNSK